MFGSGKRERERERDRQRQTDRQTDREKERKRERDACTVFVCQNVFILSLPPELVCLGGVCVSSF